MGQWFGFGKIVWIGDRCFKDRFPGLARLCPIKNGNVQSFASLSPVNADLVNWDFCFPRNLTERESCEAADLMASLESFRL